jgi:hypothetical protein
MLGTVMVVMAYLLMQLDRVDPKGLSYNLINLMGAILLLTSLWFHFNLASFVIEIFWIAASLIGVWKYCRRQGTASQSTS